MERKGHLIMARIGKIVRLNPAVRTQLNSRLADGAGGQPILHWLNCVPPIRGTLARFSGLRPKKSRPFVPGQGISCLPVLFFQGH